jgi:hypothetical protein
MKKSIKVDQKKGRGRPATGRGTMVSSRIPPPLVDNVDDWALRNETTRSDAIRRLVELGLASQVRSTPSQSLRAARASETLSSLPVGSADEAEKASLRCRPLKGPEEFREGHVDRPKGK